MRFQTPRPLSALRWPAAAALAAALGWLPAPPAVSAPPEPEPGQVLEVPAGAGGLKVRFRYCPPSVPKDRFKEGFWVSEAEVSQKVFFAVLGQLKESQLAEWTGRQARTDAQAYKDTMSEKGDAKYVGDDFPVFCLGVHEAALFCKALDELRSPDELGEGPVTFTFRLPTVAEWQYACRSQRDDAGAKRYPYFHSWAADCKGVLGERDFTTLKELSDRMGKGRFEGTQEQFFGLLAELPKHPKERGSRDKAFDCLTKVLKEATGVDLNLTSGERELLPTTSPAGASKGWQIRHMHGNVAEWAVQGPPDWAKLRQDGQGVGKVFACGGHFRTPPPHANDTAWQTFTIGGAAEVDYEQAISRGNFPGEFAGIRLVVGRRADPGRWLLAVRRRATGAAVPDVAGWRKGLDRQLEELAEVAPEQRGGARAYLDFYEGLVHLRRGNAGAAGRALGEWQKSLRELAGQAKPAADQVGARLKALADQRADLAKVDAGRAAALGGRLDLYGALLHHHRGEQKEAAAALNRWLAGLRRAATAGPRPTPERVKELDEDLEDLKKIDPPAAGPLKGLVQQYSALARYRRGDAAGAGQALDRARASSPDDDTYLAAVKEVMAPDRPGKK
jgi:hypothetical protein